jgi:RimJ/RimL family protein N-acetyltransferase
MYALAERSALAVSGVTGTMTVLEAHHRNLVLEMHDRLSPETVRLRYFSPFSPMRGDLLERTTTPRPGECEYLGVLSRRALVAMCGYHRVGKSTAELSLLVEDAFQGRGLGTSLARRLVESAASKGMPDLVARTLPENRRVRHVLAAAGCDAETFWDDGVIEIRFRAPDPTTTAHRAA